MRHEELISLLIRLRLSQASKSIDKHISHAEENHLTYEEFLYNLLEEEDASRKERRIKMLLKKATIAVPKTLDNFDFNHPDKINHQLVKSLFDLSFIEQKANVIFMGLPGLGKSHLSSALAYTACMSDYKCRFLTAMTLINELKSSISDNSFLRCMKRFISLDLLVIDELGYLPIDKSGSDLLFQVISNRYETGSVIITTNKPFKQWGEVFNGDNSLASAVLDRLVHHCELVKIEGKSYRVKK